MSDIETELNTLRSIIAQQSTMLAALEQRVSASRAQDHAAAILTALADAKHLTVAQIVARCNLTKSQVWHNLWKLERDGAVWIRHRKDHKTGRSYDEIYHADAIVT